MMRLPAEKKPGPALLASVLVVVLLAVFFLGFYWLKTLQAHRSYSFQHLEAAGADPSLGPTEVSPDGTVDPEEFVTHLPLIVLDTFGEEVPDIYRRVDAQQTRDYADPNVTDPYIPLSFTLYDSPDHVNRLGDAPSFTNQGRIKLRGNSSRHFEKKQYGIKLLQEDGSELEYPLLGMEADEDWILCNSILDASYVRSYLAFNLGSIVMPYTPGAKFCEVLRKNGDSYEYLGLYLLTESVKKAKGRVDIADYQGNPRKLSYIIDRDRYDHTATMLSTYASDQQLCYGWFTLCYPKGELADDATVEAIQNEVSAVERVLYSDDLQVMLRYPYLLNVDSFVDYLVLNEFLMNYDAGEHSTYYYRDHAHKLSIGPIWDYDNCLDNYNAQAAGISWMVLPFRAWYDRLVKDPAFVEKVCKRYHQLRKTVFSDAFVEEFVNGASEFLGNAALRETSRWRETYEAAHQLRIVEGDDGLIINRRRSSQKEELQRLLDVQQLHAAWMDDYIESFLQNYEDEQLEERGTPIASVLAVTMVLLFLSAVYFATKIYKSEVS